MRRAVAIRFDEPVYQKSVLYIYPRKGTTVTEEVRQLRFGLPHADSDRPEPYIIVRTNRTVNLSFRPSDRRLFGLQVKPLPDGTTEISFFKWNSAITIIRELEKAGLFRTAHLVYPLRPEEWLPYYVNAHTPWQIAFNLVTGILEALRRTVKSAVDRFR